MLPPELGLSVLCITLIALVFFLLKIKKPMPLLEKPKTLLYNTDTEYKRATDPVISKESITQVVKRAPKKSTVTKKPTPTKRAKTK